MRKASRQRDSRKRVSNGYKDDLIIQPQYFFLSHSFFLCSSNEHSQNAHSEIPIGDIAQLARAAALQAVGRGFESLYLHEAAQRGRRGPFECSFTYIGKGSRLCILNSDFVAEVALKSSRYKSEMKRVRVKRITSDKSEA